MTPESDLQIVPYAFMYIQQQISYPHGGRVMRDDRVAMENTESFVILYEIRKSHAAMPRPMSSMSCSMDIFIHFYETCYASSPS